MRECRRRRRRPLVRTTSVLGAAALCLAATAAVAQAGASRHHGSKRHVTRLVYDDFRAPYTLADYAKKWVNPYGLGDMAVAPGDTRRFAKGAFHVADAPFRTSADFSVFDHLKYIATSATTFPVPAAGGSVTFSSVITADTRGIQKGRVVHGSLGGPGTFGTPAAGAPYAARTLDGQQAAAVMNMIDFGTGQLFDWFVTRDTAFALIERLPSSVTGNTTDTSSPDYVGPGKMYTQIVEQVRVGAGPHRVAITYRPERGGTASVTYRLDGRKIATIHHVGLPLDSPARHDHPRWTGLYSSATYPGGPRARGEELGGKITGLTIGHGTFSLLDAFPFQWGWGADATGPFCLFAANPALAPSCGGSVSIPDSERRFGQGVNATFDDFVVTTRTP